MLYKIGFAVEYFYVKVLANPPSLQSLPATCCSCLGFERLPLVSEFAPPPPGKFCRHPLEGKLSGTELNP